jgi:poly-gamma-glutamate system protein
MKKMYWTAYNVHPYLMITLCLLSLLCLYIVETNKKLVQVNHYDLKLQATLKAGQAFEELKSMRKSKGIRVDKRHDPSMSGLIGREKTDITSDHGVLRSKQIALNPNLAALIVTWLQDLGLKEGDTVAIGMTGSFPSIDISTLAAVQTMKLKPLIILSSTASQWGANIPHFSILDMMADLKKKGIFDYDVLGASIGASQDQGKNLNQRGLNLILDTIKKYKYPLIKEPLVSESINKRLDIYKQASDGAKIKAYINVGGGVASIGKHFAVDDLTADEKKAILKHSLKTGPNVTLPVTLANTNSVAIRYLKQGIPVINLKNINVLAAKYNLKPWDGSEGVGIGPLFFTPRYNLWFAAIGLVLIMLFCALLVKVQLIQKKAQAGDI